MKIRTLLLSAVLLAGGTIRAELNSVRLTGQAQPNCSTVEDIVAAVTKGAGSDREKALALHHFGMAHFIHFDGPIEDRGEYVNDPMKLINVYGYALCGNNSCAMSALYNAAGLKARTRSVPGHSIPEVWFEGKWNYIDTDMFGYVFLPDGHLASVDELIKDPDLFVTQKNPPTPFFPFDKKTSMADTFRTQQVYTNFHPYANAHLMNLSLRSGESASLFFRPQGRGRYVLSPTFRQDLGFEYKDYFLEGAVRAGSLAWCDEKPASYGNGVIRYEPKLKSEAFRLENPDQQNVVAGVGGQREPELKAAAGGKTASLIVKVATPYVIAGLQNDLTNFDDQTDGAVVSGLFWRREKTDENRILVSTDAGQTWTKVWENRHEGAVPFAVDLTRYAEGKYQYWVKFEWLDRAGSGKVGLEGLKTRTWVQVSPMSLPRLVAGKNSFEFSSAPAKAFYNYSFWDRGAGLPGQKLENLRLSDKTPFLRPEDPSRPGVLTFPLGHSGTAREVRVSMLARAAQGSQGVSLVLSLSKDDGATWSELERYSPNPGHTMNHMWFNHVIRNQALNGKQTLLRISVTGGGLEKVIANSVLEAAPSYKSPLRITHIWREDGQERSATRVIAAGSAKQSYEVLTGGPKIVNQEVRLEALAQ